MTGDNASRLDVGLCSGCGRVLRAKPRGLRAEMRLTCKCGLVRTVSIDESTLARHGMLRAPVVEDIFQDGGTPYFRLLDGPRLRTRWAEVEARQVAKWQDLPPALRPPVPDIIFVSMNPYRLEGNARHALRVLVERLQERRRVRPWCVEFYENAECAVLGLLDAPFFVFLGMAEMAGSSADENYDTFREVVRDLRSDDLRARSGGEWEIRSQHEGNLWRSDRCARLKERWVFLDADLVLTFGVTGIT